MDRRFVADGIVIGAVGVGLPLYYKARFVLEGTLSFESALDASIVWDFAFSVSLVTLLVLGHEWLSTRARLESDSPPAAPQVLARVALTGLASLAVVALYTQFFFTWVLPSPIPDDFLLDLSVVGLAVPLLVTGVRESIAAGEGWERTALQKEAWKRRTAEARYDALRNQVDPHFLFNSFNTLVELIDESRELAVRFVHQLASVFRYSLEVRDAKLVRLGAELDVLRSYVFLLQTRLGESLTVATEVAPEQEQLALAPLTLQMLLDNALKHNAASPERPLRVTIEVAEGPSLVFRNTLQKKAASSSTRVGLDNLVRRYEYLSDRLVEVAESASEFAVVVPLARSADA